MIDTESIRATVDLLRLVENDTALKRVANSGGGEYAGACPFCGGRDRFRVQPDARRWLCRACTNGAWHDAIEYTKRREHCDFRRACEILGGTLSIDNLGGFSSRDEKIAFYSNAARRAAPTPEPTPRANAVWQHRARAFVEMCAAELWSANGAKARAWLSARGLNDETLRAFGIGYHSADRWEEPGAWDLPEERDEKGRAKRVWLPRGIVLPCEVGGALHYVKVRRATDDPKYYKLRGSRVGLFGAANFRAARAAALCEGELDALLLWQHAQDLAAIGTFGSATDKPNGSEYADLLLPIPLWLVVYDADAAGIRGAAWWNEFSSRARCALPPRIRAEDKDLTDFWQSGGDLRAWLAFELARHGIAEAQPERAPARERADVSALPVLGEGDLAGFFGYASPFVSAGIWKKRAGLYWHKPGARFLDVSAHDTAEVIGT